MAGRTVSAGAMLSLALLWAVPAGAQVYHFENTPVPAGYSLTTHYMFYVYSQDEAPSKTQGFSPMVEFRQLASKKSGATNPPPSYNSVEVSLLPFDEFWTLINKERFCSTERDVMNQKADANGKLMLVKPSDKTLAQMGARVQNAPFVNQQSTDGKVLKTVSYEISKSGKYILTFTNCGNFSEATVTGAIAVKNAYGYLPAYEFFTMRLFGWLTLLYAVVFTVWFASLIRYRKGLFYIHKGMCTITLFCLLECLLTWIQYRDWNTTGDRRDFLFVSSLLFYTLKYVLSWRLLLLASLGAGVVLQDLSTKTTVIFFVASTCFLLQSCFWKLIISYRYSHALDTKFLMMITVPGVIVYTAMFSWAFLSLSSLISRISEQKQDELTQLFTRVRNVLVVGVGLSVCVTMLQVMDISNTALLPWEYQWLSVDGAPQFGFTVVLVCMMAVWWPTDDGWKWGYMVQQNEENDGLAGADEDDGESGSAKKPKKKNVVAAAPEAIGVPADDKDEDDDL